MGTITQGKRLPDAQMGVPGPGWEAWEQNDCAPGSYMKVSTAWKDNPGRILWYIRDPDGRIGSLSRLHHVVVEHDDRTISVTPSILADDSRSASEQMGGKLPGAIAGPGWHGYLERGMWREC